MSDNIKDVYNVVSKSNLFVDENDFRNQVNSNPKEVFEFISKDKNTKGLFVDFNDFQDNLKKKLVGEHFPIQNYLQHLENILIKVKHWLTIVFLSK